ncbi:MAG: dethiobiotin synthase [Flavobacteriales bacterium]|nr:dethiobiotin synthase [Flavobacteriales bacterium]
MKYFVTGIGTEIGKTIASAILVEALEANYWKPIQAGELEYTDSQKVSDLISNTKSEFHPECFRLKLAMSPHAAAQAENITINISECQLPETSRPLIIEGAGGLLVPLNNEGCIIDLIKELNVEVILISQHYLGSINHTLLSIEALKSRNIPIKGILFNGDENSDTEHIILSKSGLHCLGRIPLLETVDQSSIKEIAEQLKAVF